jgi:heme oxygenase (biliverdin-IX-beta and delta-forming)
VTILDRLRSETRPAHDRIEGELRLDETLASTGAYVALLSSLLAFYKAWEPWASPIIDDAPFFDERRKSHLLRRDLDALAGRDIEPIPAPRAALPRRDSVAAAYGSMYVLEGSSLGSAVIAREIERRLGLGPGTGAAYFRSYGALTGRMWTLFRARLLSVSHVEEEDEIVEAAMETFERLRAWIGTMRAPGLAIALAR